MEEDKKEKKWTAPVILKICTYCLVILILASGLFWLCLASILKFNEWPIYTETNIVPQQDVPFPSMTFCALSESYKKDILKVS